MTPSTHLTFVLIIASVRAGRIGPSVARWFLDQLPPQGPEFDVVDLAEPTGTATTRLLDHADGFVVVTPEYNHSYPGELKVLIDSHRREWKHKPVTFVSYGGMSGGLRAVEHLRTVFAELYVVEPATVWPSTCRGTTSRTGPSPSTMPLPLRHGRPWMN